MAAGLPSQLVGALTADALAEEGPTLVDEWGTWLRLWRARLAEEGMQEEVGTDVSCFATWNAGLVPNRFAVWKVPCTVWCCAVCCCCGGM
jgi:hypothetical protein